jgi:hypothetical protein
VWGYHRQGENDITNNIQEFNVKKTVNNVAEEM